MNGASVGVLMAMNGVVTYTRYRVAFTSGAVFAAVAVVECGDDDVRVTPLPPAVGDEPDAAVGVAVVAGGLPPLFNSCSSSTICFSNASRFMNRNRSNNTLPYQSKMVHSFVWCNASNASMMLDDGVPIHRGQYASLDSDLIWPI